MAVIGSGIRAFAKANAVCCQVASGCSFLLALALIIGGSILVDKNKEELPWDALCDDFEQHHNLQSGASRSSISIVFCFLGRQFAAGVAMVFFGCVALVAASIMLCCACGFAAFGNTSKSEVATSPYPQTVCPCHMQPGGYPTQPVATMVYPMGNAQTPTPISLNPYLQQTETEGAHYPTAPGLRPPPPLNSTLPPYEQAVAPYPPSAPVQKY
ncbi:unnamed protein product [Mesocestoides corti]|uniref:Uncharacterized protein n=1 Tax=Mesocestoides corti TaxID=53468 RepID=A0A0R3U5D4_MESCO|nr:unnamed protein product [Mesocestoides corti]